MYNSYVYKQEHNEKGTNIHLMRSIEKYGFDAFEVNEEFDVAYSKEELAEKEIYWISYYESDNPLKGYNILKGGEGIYKKYDSFVKTFAISLQFAEIHNGFIDKIVSENIVFKNCRKNSSDADILNIVNAMLSNMKIKKCIICGRYHLNKGKYCSFCLSSKYTYTFENNKESKEIMQYMLEHKNLYIDYNKINDAINEKIDSQKRFYFEEGIPLTDENIKLIRSFKNRSVQCMISTLILCEKIRYLYGYTYSKNEILKISGGSTKEYKDNALNELNEKGYIKILENNIIILLTKEELFKGEEKLRIKILKRITSQIKSFLNKSSSEYRICTVCGLPYKKYSKNDFTSKYCPSCRKVQYKKYKKKK